MIPLEERVIFGPRTARIPPGIPWNYFRIPMLGYSEKRKPSTPFLRGSCSVPSLRPDHLRLLALRCGRPALQRRQRSARPMGGPELEGHEGHGVDGAVPWGNTSQIP